MRYLFHFILLVLLIASASLVGQGPRDPVGDRLTREMYRRAGKEAAQKSYRELKEASLELALAAKELNEGIEKSSEHVISARVFDQIEKIEKLTKRIKDRAKGPEGFRIGREP